MNSQTEIQLFFNFRSPYCYLASQSMWPIFDDYSVKMIWRPLAGWDGRTPPEQAKAKIPLARQDVSRWCKRLGLAMNPPPVHTDPSKAAILSLLAEEQNLLRDFIIKLMQVEWEQGQDIGDIKVLTALTQSIGMDPQALQEALSSPKYLEKLEQHKQAADELGVIGVPTFVIGEEIFWGNDRQDFVHEYLQQLGLKSS